MSTSVAVCMPQPDRCDLVVDDDPWLRTLRRHRLLDGVAHGSMRPLLAATRVESAEVGDSLVTQGAGAEQALVVLDGHVKLVCCTRAGEEKIVETVGPGGVIGLSILFLRERRSPVAAVVVDSARVARLPTAEYQELLRRDAVASLNLIRCLSEQLHGQLQDLLELALDPAPSRLLRLIEARLPAGQPDPCLITLRESRQEIAARLSVKTETVSRMLRQLQDAGVIVVRGRQLEVPDRRRLRALLESGLG